MSKHTHKALEALRDIACGHVAFGDEAYLHKSKMTRIALEAIPALEALLAERDELLAALDGIGDADQVPGHVNYLTKARMAEYARETVAKARGES